MTTTGLPGWPWGALSIKERRDPLLKGQFKKKKDNQIPNVHIAWKRKDKDD